MFIYIHSVDYTILTELDEDINILICSALLVCLSEHKHRAVWLMATKDIKFKSLEIGYIYIKFNGLIVPATAFFQDDVCGKMLFFFCFFLFCFFWLWRIKLYLPLFDLKVTIWLEIYSVYYEFLRYISHSDIFFSGR